MKHKLLFGLMIAALVCGVTAFAQDSRDVTFRVDMSVQIAMGKFDAATGTVDVRGGFTDWQVNPVAMSREVGTDIWSVTTPVPGAENETMEYKFYASGTLEWKNFQDNRTFQLGPADTPQTLDVVYFNDELILGDDVQADVTFSVDMTVEIDKDSFDPEGDQEVLVRGGFNEWEGNSFKLDREGNTGVYSGTFSVTAQENALVEYKFVYTTSGSGGDAWESFQENRTFIMGNGSPQVLPTVYFNNEAPPTAKDLEFTGGTWNPNTIGNYEFELTRVEDPMDVGQIALSSDNEDAVTVPLSVMFDTGSNTVAFMATVVSLAAGDATITASNTTSGAWDTYTVRAPALALDGPTEVFSADLYEYTVTRFAGISDTLNLQSSDTSVMSVPVNVTFADDADTASFNATALAEGETTLTVTDPANGISAMIDVAFSEPHMVISGPAVLPLGQAKTYVLTRFGAIGDDVNLTSSDDAVVSVPATVSFPYEGNTVAFQATGEALGVAEITAANDDGSSAPFEIIVEEAGTVIAHDHAGNYTVETFVDGANEGFGFGAWDFWNADATLGDSTSGGGGDLNSANGLSFKFGRSAETNYCNARRNFDGALGVGDTVSFTFTYNWDGGGRGVDIFDANEQFANLINVGPGNTFSVNENTVSTEWSPGAVVEVEITQLADGISMSLVRSVEGVANLTYTTNIANALPATGFSMYCGGYDYSAEDEANYAIYMNDLMIVSSSEPVKSLTLSGPTKIWLDEEFAPEYTLTRSGDVADLVSLSSSDTGVLTVPTTVSFQPNENTVTFMGTVVGAGITALTAENDDATSASLGVVVAERIDYIAYDDASLYADGEWADSPAHQTGFSDWTVLLTPEVTTPEEEIYRGVFIGSSPIEGMDEGGESFGLYANYNGEVAPDPAPEVKVIRSFPELAVGQTFTVDVGYNWSSGTKGVKLLGTYDGNTYNRIELFNAGSDTWCYKLDDDDETIEVAWDGYINDGFVGTMQVTCTAENTFTLTLQRARENAVIVGNIVLPGGIDTVEFYNWNGGSGDEENFYFNRMGIFGAQPEPEPEGPAIAAVSLANGDIGFSVPEGYSLVLVQGADCDLVGDGFDWQDLVFEEDYTIDNGNVTILTDGVMRMLVRIWVTPSN